MTVHDDNSTAAEYDIELQSLSQLLSELSSYSDHVPTGIESDVLSSEFVATSSNFYDNTWVSLLLNIQGWLGLDSSVSAESEPETIVESIFIQIPPRNASDCFQVVDDGIIKLTIEGIDRLSTRIEKALSLKENFISSVEEGQPLKLATKDWEEAWDDENLQSRRYVSNINAKVGTWEIYTFKSMAGAGKFDLNPSYQRDVVWSNKDSSLLIESILRGIPLPSVIFSEGSSSYQIVDGKQRLTSILRFIGEHPDGIDYVKDIGGDVKYFREDFPKFFRKYRIRTKDQNEHFLPFKLGRFPEGDPLSPFSGKYYTQIKDESIYIGGDKITVEDLFESPSCDYRIPTIIYKNTEVQDIHHVFGLYNKQGKKLNAEELRNAAYHNLKLARLLLVLSGDRTEPELLEDLVPFLDDTTLERVQEVGDILDARGFGTARFKRTKVLSWVLSIFLHPPNSNNSIFVTPSTAGHINNMLMAIQEKQATHILNSDTPLCALAKEAQDAVLLHQDAMEAWPPSLRNKQSHEGKWEELPLVACLLGTIIVVVAGKRDHLISKIDDVRELFSRIVIPEKTQNKTQWQFISFVALELVRALDLPVEHVGELLSKRYGYNCIPTLEQISGGTSWYQSQENARL